MTAGWRWHDEMIGAARSITAIALVMRRRRVIEAQARSFRHSPEVV